MMEVRGAQLLVEQDAEGRDNWTFTEGGGC